MRDIKDLSLSGLEAKLKNWEEPAFHARQIFSWIYKKGAADFSRMSDLPADLRKKLQDNFYLFGLKLTKKLESKDGTEKFLFALKDKNFIEAVAIPEKNRMTGCLSTQAGCRFACRFCASGLGGFQKNLSCGQMLEEALYLKNHSRYKKLTHLVFMGTGEPLDNYENVIKAIRIINSPDALGIGARRITISTCGIIPGIKRLAQEGLQVELSVSLHAADDKTRSEVMPINKKYPLKELITACRGYIQKTNRQITFEYILMQGINSGLQNARNLIKILKGLGLVKVNLIPANPIRELKVTPPAEGEIRFFRDYLVKGGLQVTLRRERGEDIEASCGQLRLRHAQK
ncbi:MAG: 23S rRNA (adenine(2503)-C(2))-methyltransferase RlmN [Candidatus Omnitrophica bacterium]|nr:23S rRNA (adenine(2503)-C(2))-methyltransferase RlmN [Candidatus Omnitrophota bacterium]MDD5592147.1 23S rRNA (adenine(2503)-C(2))-methyltransferase RlmN [Candidatus Omnitrophota bacterium]